MPVATIAGYLGVNVLKSVRTGSGVASAKFFGPKCLTLCEQQYFCLVRRFSKHKITRYAKINYGPSPSELPGYAYEDRRKMLRL